MSENKEKKGIPMAEHRQAPDTQASQPTDPEKIERSYISDGIVDEADGELALDDERRVKVLSPTDLVLRRFLRNRLAIVGLVILILMFLFSFLGGVLSPYEEDEQFMTKRSQFKEFAGMTDNREYRYIKAEGMDFPLPAQARFVAAKNSGKTSFSASNGDYSYEQLNDESYLISGFVPVAKGVVTGSIARLEGLQDGFTVSEDLKKAATEAIKKKAETFTVGEEEYKVKHLRGKEYQVSKGGEVALGSTFVFASDDSSNLNELDYRIALEKAIKAGESTFSYADTKYTLEKVDEKSYRILKDGSIYGLLSRYVVQTVRNDAMPLDLRKQITDAVFAGQSELVCTEGEEEVTYEIIRTNDKWRINRETSTQVLDTYAPPSLAHPIGTDVNGMDLMTRLMYGGRISLLVGFVVTFIAMFIGVIMGGISGFFGGWVDMIIMRIVDIFYCVPTYPILIIMGAVMDGLDIKSTPRMMFLMVVLGLLYWSGVARMVRGQILQLREEEYMVAAESTGLSTKRRIFRHLVPNVMPLLIVEATMSIGSTILTESTLSFLGLGIKFPYASWGNIINAVSNQHVMTQYPFVWIPAGICIVLTVIAFNFVGDGLRDAFDPRMNR